VYNKFLGTGERGYHPVRKIKVCLSGLRYAMRDDFSVSYKFALSAIILVISFVFRAYQFTPADQN